MTTVFYDGQILAVDSMSTVTKSTTCNCRECGANASTLVEHNNKLRVPTWEGKVVNYPGSDHKVLAVTGSGDGYLIDAVSEGIARGIPVRGLIPTIVTAFGRRHGGKVRESTIVIATTNGIYSYNVTSEGKTTWQKETGTFGIGSGRGIAMLAYRYLNQNAIGAVAMATLTDKGSGGPINYIDLSDDEPTVKRWAPTKQEIEALFTPEE